MNEKRKAKWVAQTHSLENMADMMNREMRRRFRIRTNRSLVDGVLGDFALEDLDNSTEFERSPTSTTRRCAATCTGCWKATAITSH